MNDSDKEALSGFLGDIISDAEQKKSDREKEIEQLKQDVRELLIGKTITAINFHEHGYMLSIETEDAEIRPTSETADDPDYNDFYWLEIWTETDDSEQE